MRSVVRQRTRDAVATTIAATATLLVASSAPAANLYWDANGIGTGGTNSTSANGTWGSSNFWSGAAGGNATTSAWSSGATAVFSAGTNVSAASNVSVSGTQTAAGLTFEEGTVTLSGSGTVALAGANPIITVGVDLAPRAATILATVSAAGPVTIARGTADTATLTLNAANTFNGGVTLAAGVRVNANATSALGAAGVAVADSGAAIVATPSNANVTLPNPITLNPANTAGGFVTAFAAGGTILGGARLIVAGDITGAGDVAITTNPNDPSIGGGIASNAANGLTVFGGNNSYTGRTVVNVAASGAFQIGSSGALPATTALVLGAGAGAAGEFAGAIDLAGRDITVTSLATDLAAASAVGLTNSNSAAGGNITITGSAHTTFAAPIGAANTAALGTFGYSGSDRISITLAASHTGSLTLASINTYTGATTILGGTLRTSGAGTLGAPGSAVVNRATLQIYNDNALGTLDGPADGSAGATTVGDGVTAATVSATHVRQNALAVAAGSKLTINASGGIPSGASKVASLSLASTATLDLKDNKLITTVAPGSATGGVYDGVQGMVQRAANGGAWDQPGLTTSMPDAAAGITSIAVATGEQVKGIGPSETALFAGQTITGASTLAMYTYAGDANLDGQITGDDYSAIDFAILVPASDGWYNGDFNYDGSITGDDYSAIDFNILAQGAPFPTSADTRVTATPEPSSLTLLVVTSTLLTRRRRRTSGTAPRS